MNLGEKIQQLRKASGLSQEQLAAQLDVSRQSVSKWELNESVPEISKIVMMSELFSISTDELLKENPVQAEKNDDGSQSVSMLERVTMLNLAHKQLTMGFITMICGFVMLVLEFMFLPIFGTMQKEHVNGQGFYSDFMKYAQMQPMPIIFGFTVAIIVIGLFFLLKGYWYRRNSPADEHDAK